MCRHKSFWRDTKCSQIFGLAQKIWTGTKHFETCKRTRHNWLLIQTRSFILFFSFIYHQYSTGKAFLRCLIRPLLPSSLQVRTTVWSLEGSSRITVLTGGGARIFRPCIPVFRCHRPERNEVYIYSAPSMKHGRAKIHLSLVVVTNIIKTE